MASNEKHEIELAPSLKGVAYHEDDVDRHLALQKPEILQGLSDAETAALDKATTRKLDILMMPTLVLLYILNYLDRQNIASAKIAGIDKDLGLSAVQYQTAVAILFAGYVALQIPSNMIVAKIKWYVCIGSIANVIGPVSTFAACAPPGVSFLPAPVLCTLMPAWLSVAVS